MTTGYPYGKVRTNDTIVHLNEGAEAGIARSEFQQVLFCTGEAATEEPILFGRAFESPPYFTYSSVAKNNEVVLVAGDCGDAALAGSTTRRITGATIGVSEWIRDEQGMYVGANMWYRVDAVDLDRASGTGIIAWTYNENTNIAEVPDCGFPGDYLIVFTTQIGQFTNPGLDTQGWTLIRQNGLTSDGTGGPRPQVIRNMWIGHKAWDDEPLSYLLDQGSEWVAVALIRGMTGEFTLASDHSRFTVLTGPHVADPSSTYVMENEKEVMISVLYSQHIHDVTNNDALFVGMKKLDPGPNNVLVEDGFGAGVLYYGLGDINVPQQKEWRLPIAQFTHEHGVLPFSQGGMDWFDIRIMVR